MFLVWIPNSFPNEFQKFLTPICSIYGIFKYISIHFGDLLEKMVVNISYMEHMGYEFLYIIYYILYIIFYILYIIFYVLYSQSLSLTFTMFGTLLWLFTQVPKGAAMRQAGRLSDKLNPIEREISLKRGKLMGFQKTLWSCNSMSFLGNFHWTNNVLWKWKVMKLSHLLFLITYWNLWFPGVC